LHLNVNLQAGCDAAWIAERTDAASGEVVVTLK
jgi:hypothetical protein